MRIAMWSGPRNLSPAMMYAFAQRADCAVWDEPFYAAYLAATGLDHPMRDAILAAGETDPRVVAARCAGPAPQGRAVFYQKQMTHHQLPGFPTDWMAEAAHVFLLRHPTRVVASYAKKREAPVLEDLGFVQQRAIFERVRGMGLAPIVIDSADVRADPERALTGLCAALGLAFDPAMLAWPAGGRAEDGVWAPHWYGAIHRSTGFEAAEGPVPDLPGDLAAVAEAALPHYEAMRAG
ncbi:MAG: HAD family hydrolase [Pseudomonadota bacterium]